MSSPATPVTPPSSSQLELKEYSEDQDFKALGNPEPNTRSQTVIYHYQNKKWWIKVTLKNSVYFYSCTSKPRHVKTKRERRVEFQTFVTLINFQLLVSDFLDDTVTEIIINEYPKTDDGTYLPIQSKDGIHKSLIEEVPYRIQEDPFRVRYPLCHDFPSFQHMHVNELIQEVEISNGVFRVLHQGSKTPYILKVVNCPLYYPRDTQVIEKELENLELFRGVEGIVQPAGVAVFSNPYASTQESSEMVISGILMEYYNGGTFDWLLHEDCVTDSSWERWALQIGNALDTMHRAGKTHMDLKPSNIVLDKNGNAVIIDISCFGGVTHEWQAPEILHEIAPLDLPFEVRESNDNWAYGMILKHIALKVEDDSSMRTLTVVADHLTQDVPARCTLSDAIFQLKPRRANE